MKQVNECPLLKILKPLLSCSSDYLLGLTAQSSPAVIDVSVLTPEQIAAVHTLIEGISEKNKI